MSNLRTREEALEFIYSQGVSVAKFAKMHGFKNGSVEDLLQGRKRGVRGEARRVAVILGMVEPGPADEGYEPLTDFSRIDEASMRLMSQLYGDCSTVEYLSKFSGVGNANVRSFLNGDWGDLDPKKKSSLVKCFKGYAAMLKQKIRAEIEDSCCK